MIRQLIKAGISQSDQLLTGSPDVPMVPASPGGPRAPCIREC